MTRAPKSWFCVSAGAILVITGIAKIWSSFGDVRILTVPNPLLGLTFGHLMLAVGLLEVVVATVCFFNRSIQLAVSLVAWLATSFLFYRIGLARMGYHKPCSCLGNLTDALHIAPQTADTAMKFILAYLLVGSYGTLFWLWRRHRKAEGRVPNDEIKPTGSSQREVGA